MYYVRIRAPIERDVAKITPSFTHLSSYRRRDDVRRCDAALLALLAAHDTTRHPPATHAIPAASAATATNKHVRRERTRLPLPADATPAKGKGTSPAPHYPQASSTRRWVTNGEAQPHSWRTPRRRMHACRLLLVV